MLDVTGAAWAATIAAILALLALDLVVSGRRTQEIAFRSAAGWSLFYVGVAIAFGVAFGAIAGWDYGAQYFAGYIVEKSLSVDNLFVFVIIMGAFAVPAMQQPKVLTFGILVALVLRAIFIALGAALLAVPLVPPLAAGLGLTAFGASLNRLDLRRPELRRDGGLRSSQQGIGIAKDMLLTAIGAALMLDSVFAPRRHR